MIAFQQLSLVLCVPFFGFALTCHWPI